MSDPQNTVPSPAAGWDDLDARYAEQAREPYGFTWHRQQWTLPHMNELDWRLLEKIRSLAGLELDSEELDDADSLRLLDDVGQIMQVAFGEQWEAWQKTPQPVGLLLMLFGRWRDHSGDDLGEASSSAASSQSTAGPSKRTSAATTKSGSKRSSSARGGTRRGRS